MIIKYYCDRCKEEIHGNYVRIRIERRVILNNENPDPDVFYPNETGGYADICSECYTFLSSDMHILPKMPNRDLDD